MASGIDHGSSASGGHAEGQRAPRTVLIADDDRDMRGQLAVRLRQLGYRVIEAEDGFEFLDYLNDIIVAQDGEVQPEIVVCDLHMPGLASLATIASLRPESSSPVIVLTSANGDMEQTNARALRLPAARVFARPFDVDAIVSFCSRTAPP